MKTSPFEFAAYKAYIHAWLKSQPNEGHGLRTVLAKAAQCNPAYMTQVLSSEAHLSLEQAEKLHRVFGLTTEELDYFLLLVEKDRAGSTTLREHFQKKIAAIQKQRSQLKNRVNVSMDLSQEVQMKYFSSWLYSAVHVATTLPRLRTAQDIAKELKLEAATIRNVLQFLEKHGLIQATSKGYQTGSARMHLPHDSNLIAKHHQNWRIEAIKSLDQVKESDLHYSSVVSISNSDFKTIREMLLKAIQDAKETIRESKEETLASFCVDFFRISADEGLE